MAEQSARVGWSSSFLGATLFILAVLILAWPQAALAQKPNASATNNAAADAAYQNGDFDLARRLWAQGCEGGRGGDCYELAIVYRDGEGVAPDRPRYLELMRRACDDDVGAGCHNLAREQLRELEDFGTQVSAGILSSGIALYEKACALGVDTSCSNLSLHRGRQARESGGDVESFVRGLDELCRSGTGASCFQIANAFDVHSGGMVEEDPARANEYLLLGCEQQDRESCQNLGYHYINAYGVDRDQLRAATLYNLACDEDPQFNCPMLGARYFVAPAYDRSQYGNQIHANWQAAAGAYIAACEADFAPGCFGMAKLIARSGNAAKYEAEMRQWLARALELSPDYVMARELLRRLEAGELPEEALL